MSGKLVTQGSNNHSSALKLFHIDCRSLGTHSTSGTANQ
jgi:hypothetical protein